MSHKTGIRIDVGELTRALSAHPYVWMLIDGAHAAGTSAQLIQSGIDFYLFPGHKWLFGPVETGVLWVSDRVLKDTHPLMSGAPMMSVEGIRYEDPSGAWRYEYGTRDWSKMVGLRVAMEFRQQWAEAELVLHYQGLGASFAEGFHRVCGTALGGAAPLFTIATHDSNIIANAVWENHRVIIKPQEGNLRISLPPWLSSDRSRELGEWVGKAVTEVGEK